jgi:hypothetical protein
MQSEHVDEALLIRYLLGSLTEEEQVEIENRAFTDSNYMAALETAEADLIDAYVRAHLSPAERRAFEHRFLTSPGRRSKVEFARALAIVASESQADILVRPRQSLLGLIRGWKPLAQATAVAILILVAGGSWLIVRNAAIRSRPASPAAVASLVFLPGLTRAENRVEQLHLSASVQIVHVEIQLEPRDDYPRFRAELHTRSGKEILTEDNLSSHRTDADYSVTFDVPATMLAAGQYELALKGIPDNQSVQDIGYYYFNVHKQ